MNSAENFKRLIINKSLQLKPDGIEDLRVGLLLVLAKYVYYYKFNEFLYPEPILYKKYGPRIDEGIDYYYPYKITEPITHYDSVVWKDWTYYLERNNFKEDMFSRKELVIVDYVINKNIEKSYHQLLNEVYLYEKALGTRLAHLDVLGKVYIPENLKHSTYLPCC